MLKDEIYEKIEPLKLPAQLWDVPAPLAALPNWVLWDENKIPLQPNEQRAKSNDPATWSTLDQVKAVAKKFGDRIGFMFQKSDGIVGIDLDGAISPDGEVAKWALRIMAMFAECYTETSPSGLGIHIIAKGNLPPGWKGKKAKLNETKTSHKEPAIEIYDNARFFTYTGDGEGEVVPVGDRLTSLLAEHWPAVVMRQSAPIQVGVGTHDVVDRARRWLDRKPPTVCGTASCHDRTFPAAQALVNGFRLSDETAMVLLGEWASRGTHRWTDTELTHKVSQTHIAPCDKPAGWLLQPREPSYAGPAVDMSGVAANATAPDADEFDVDDIDDTTVGPLAFPSDYLTPPGLLGDIARYNLETALYPQPQLALGGALALLATISGRKITDAFGTRPNCYILALGPSGCGKEHSRKVNKRLLRAAGGKALLGPERIGSHQGLISHLALTSSKLFQIDEIHRLLETMSNPSKAPHLYGIGTVLLTLYSASDELWESDGLKDVRSNYEIDCPNCVVYGTGTPVGFWESLTANNLTDGLVGRFTLFEGCYIDTPNTSIAAEIPATVLNRVKAWIDLTAGSGNLSGTNPTAIVLQHTDQARVRHTGHLQSIATRRMTEPAFNAAIWSRSGERAAKLALAFAASRWDGVGAMPDIDLEDVDAAIRLSNYMTRRLLDQGNKFVAENEWDGKVKRVLRIIAANDGISKSVLSRKTQGLLERDRDAIIRHLVNTFQIFELTKKTGGRTKTIYTTRRPVALAI